MRQRLCIAAFAVLATTSIAHADSGDDYRKQQYAMCMSNTHFQTEAMNKQNCDCVDRWLRDNHIASHSDLLAQSSAHAAAITNCAFRATSSPQ
jgi:hypothetical protein